MSPLDIFGLVAGIVLAVVGIIISVILYKRHIRINKQDTDELKNILGVQEKKIVDLVMYLDELPKPQDKSRTYKLKVAIESMSTYKFDKAISSLRECLVITQTPSEKVAYLILIGNCFLATSRLIEAEGNYQEALEVATKVNDKKGRAASCGKIGDRKSVV